MSLRRRVSWLPALLAGLLLFTSCAAPQLGVLWNAPSFALTDQTGAAYSSAALAGRVWLADFVYTNCTDVCPTYLSPKMMALQKEIQSRGLTGRVNLVTFTVDPRRDTPAVLAEYAARYQANPDVWRLLTGPDAIVQDLLQTGFKVGAALPADRVQVDPGATPQPMSSAPGTPMAAPAAGAAPAASATSAPGSYTLLHTSLFLLVDRQGRIRADYDGEQVPASDMLAGVQQLLAER